MLSIENCRHGRSESTFGRQCYVGGHKENYWSCHVPSILVIFFKIATSLSDAVVYPEHHVICKWLRSLTATTNTINHHSIFQTLIRIHLLYQTKPPYMELGEVYSEHFASYLSSNVSRSKIKLIIIIIIKTWFLFFI